MAADVPYGLQKFKFRLAAGQIFRLRQLLKFLPAIPLMRFDDRSGHMAEQIFDTTLDLGIPGEFFVRRPLAEPFDNVRIMALLKNFQKSVHIWGLGRKVKSHQVYISNFCQKANSEKKINSNSIAQSIKLGFIFDAPSANRVNQSVNQSKKIIVPHRHLHEKAELPRKPFDGWNFANGPKLSTLRSE